MAAKKRTTAKTKTKAATKKKTVTKKKATAKKATAKKTTAKKATAKKTTAKKATVKKAPVKLSPGQMDALKKVHAMGDNGYLPAERKEEALLKALVIKKLLKAGKRDKSTGKAPYLATAAGKKHVLIVITPAS